MRAIGRPIWTDYGRCFTWLSDKAAAIPFGALGSYWSPLVLLGLRVWVRLLAPSYLTPLEDATASLSALTASVRLHRPRPGPQSTGRRRRRSDQLHPTHRNAPPLPSAVHKLRRRLTPAPLDEVSAWLLEEVVVLRGEASRRLLMGRQPAQQRRWVF